MDAHLDLWAGLAEKSSGTDHSGALSWPVSFQTDREHRASYRASQGDVPLEIAFLAYLRLVWIEVARDWGGTGYGRQDRVSASRCPPEESETSAAAVVLR